MSYSFSVRVTDGTPVIENPNGATVPDGVFTISGHEDAASYASISVQRVDAAGNLIANASSASGAAAFKTGAAK